MTASPNYIIIIMQLISLMTIFFSIILLAYIAPPSSQRLLDDWRRPTMIMYSFLTITLMISIMIWIGRQSYKILIFIPVGGFFYFFFPILSSFLILSFFFQKKDHLLFLPVQATDYLIGLSCFIIFIHAIFIIVSIFYNSQLNSTILVLYKITKIPATPPAQAKSPSLT